jgi:hypothetical protein
MNRGDNSSMPDLKVPVADNDYPGCNLKNPCVAGFLTWLLPGLGHYYQGRYAKAVIFFICIVPTFVVGCVLGSSAEAGTARTVYWSWRPTDMRFWWLAQAPLGMAAIPSWVQALQVSSGQPPMLGRFMAPPQLRRDEKAGVPPVLDTLRKILPFFELGTYLTVIAGLMNLLVIFDALDGPYFKHPKGEEEKTP